MTKGLTGRGIGWILIFNHLECEKMGDSDLPEVKEKFPVPFQLFDDDGTLYFSGLMTEELYDSPDIMDPLDYAMAEWGCTELKVRGVTI